MRAPPRDKGDLIHRRRRLQYTFPSSPVNLRAICPNRTPTQSPCTHRPIVFLAAPRTAAATLLAVATQRPRPDPRGRLETVGCRGGTDTDAAGETVSVLLLADEPLHDLVALPVVFFLKSPFALSLFAPFELLDASALCLLEAQECHSFLLQACGVCSRLRLFVRWHLCERRLLGRHASISAPGGTVDLEAAAAARRAVAVKQTRLARFANGGEIGIEGVLGLSDLYDVEIWLSLPFRGST